MTIFRDISAALDKHLNEMDGLPDVAWENANYEPVIGSTFVRPTNIQGDTIQTSLGTNGNDETEGLYQVDVFTSSNTGKGAAIELADLIGDRFKRGQYLTYNGVNVRIKQTSRGVGINSDGWYQIPVNIQYLSITAATN